VRPSPSANSASMSRVESARAYTSPPPKPLAPRCGHAPPPESTKTAGADQRSAGRCSRLRSPHSGRCPSDSRCDIRRRAWRRGHSIRAHGVSRFTFQCFLNDPSDRQPHELRTPILNLAATLRQRLQLLACSLGCRYPLHRGAPLWRPVVKPDLVGSPDQAKVHPNPFSSNLRTSPRPGSMITGMRSRSS
jgi:hypothetical protein